MSPTKLITRLFALLGSYGLACIVLLLLLLLTLLGTLEQTTSSLFDVQRKYFESLIVLDNPLHVPLPGAYLLLTLLFVNLIVGGMIRLRISSRTLGVLVIHVGIAMLLVGGLIEFRASRKGHLTVYEGQGSNEFKSYFEWEVAISEALPGGGSREYVVPQDAFGDLRAGETTRVRSVHLPFELVLGDFQPNSRPQRAVNDAAGVEGMQLTELAPEIQAEANIAGIAATLAQEGGETQRGLLWGLQRIPWTVRVDDRTFAIDLRKRSWQLPFHLRLRDFTRELHPGTSIPASFHSEVACVDEAAAQDVRISMNEPLRRDGYTLYQASWGPQDAQPGAPLFSTFAVVHNPVDRLPLIACVVIALGLLFHFSPKLARHVRVQAAKT